MLVVRKAERFGLWVGQGVELKMRRGGGVIRLHYDTDADRKLWLPLFPGELKAAPRQQPQLASDE